jgi:hypothetical protein
MAKLDRTKTITTKAKAHTKGVVDATSFRSEEPVPEPHVQKGRPDQGQFSLQVDRQTKASYATYEDAEQAALVIKKGHPIVHVAIYDTVEGNHKVIEIPK